MTKFQILYLFVLVVTGTVVRANQECIYPEGIERGRGGRGPRPTMLYPRGGRGHGRPIGLRRKVKRGGEGGNKVRSSYRERYVAKPVPALKETRGTQF